MNFGKVDIDKHIVVPLTKFYSSAQFQNIANLAMSLGTLSIIRKVGPLLENVTRAASERITDKFYSRIVEGSQLEEGYVYVRALSLQLFKSISTWQSAYRSSRSKARNTLLSLIPMPLSPNGDGGGTLYARVVDIAIDHTIFGVLFRAARNSNILKFIVSYMMAMANTKNPMMALWETLFLVVGLSVVRLGLA